MNRGRSYSGSAAPPHHRRRRHRYAGAVRAAFADLDAPARELLLEDLEDHLQEVAAEAGGPLEERLGAPAAYAAELRASAGMPAQGSTHRRRARSRLRQSRLAGHLERSWRAALAAAVVGSVALGRRGTATRRARRLTGRQRRLGLFAVVLLLELGASEAYAVRPGVHARGVERRPGPTPEFRPAPGELRPPPDTTLP